MENSANWLLIYVVNRLLVVNVCPIIEEKLDILYDTMEDSDDTPYGEYTVERPYETIEDRDEIPYGEYTVERPYEIIEDRELIPILATVTRDDNPYEIIEDRELIPGIVRLLRPLPSPLIELTSIEVIRAFPLTSRVYQ